MLIDTKLWGMTDTNNLWPSSFEDATGSNEWSDMHSYT